MQRGNSSIAQKRQEFRLRNKKEALTVMWVKYKDGNTMHYYAYDEKNGKRNLEKGIKHFKNLLFKSDHAGKWERAAIYYNHDTPHGNAIHLFEHDTQIF